MRPETLLLAGAAVLAVLLLRREPAAETYTGGGFGMPDAAGYASPWSEAATAPGFTPGFEEQLLRQNEETARDIAGEQRKQTRQGGWQTGLIAATTAVALTGPAIRAARLTGGLLRAGSAARLAPAAAAGSVGAGLALGTGAVYGLHKTGALDAVERFSDRTLGRTSMSVQRAIKSAALPASALGAVATGVVGRGSVRSNLRSAFRGTYQQRLLNRVRGR